MDRYKVIRVDNFARETVPDILVTDYYMGEEVAKEIAYILNKYYSGPDSSSFFRVVPYDYVLLAIDLLDA